jgi:hypothetical protein
MSSDPLRRPLKVLATIVSLALTSGVSGAQDVRDVEFLRDHFFIGQAYPSGNVYLRSFAGEGKTSSWPAQLSLIPLARPRDRPAQTARFDHALENRIEGNVVKSLYIPAGEGMDQGHDFCGLGEIKRADSSQELLSEDFFYAITDHCEPNDGIAVYRTTPSKYSVMVIAMASPVSLSRHEVVDGRIRPMTQAEKEEVEKERRAQKAETGCTTVPGYLDKAVVRLEGELMNSNMKVRLSTYVNPGCAGHLTSIYILDILAGTDVVRRLELRQYQGPL